MASTYTVRVPADTPDPTDLPADWWTNAEVRAYLAAYGKVIARTTWSTWVSRGRAPRPDPAGRIGNYPRWRPETIRAWWRARHPELFGDNQP